ncbi:LIM/homeobox protein Lhx2-like isoform X3 [Linepithema humile]|uniref:LIM/homeobox protein Lhx2-like isoform X3 n=1 Tax=Linepithema humile TaxID=83485 RepID=UPI00351DF39F
MLKEVGCGSITPPPGDSGEANNRQVGANEGGGGGGGNGGGGGGISGTEVPLGCGGCGREIAERWYLQAAERAWHCDCLRCCHCRVPLATQTSCYARDGNIYCKEDYYRLFAVPRCSRCRAGIPASEMVMRARDLVYHVACFICASCGTPLNKGDHFGQRDGLVYCRSSVDYLTESLTTDEHVAPKTTLRAAVLRRGLRGCRGRHRGPRLAGGVAASVLLRAESDRHHRHGAEGPAAEAEAVGSHRLRATCHDETGRWSARQFLSPKMWKIDNTWTSLQTVRSQASGTIIGTITTTILRMFSLTSRNIFRSGKERKSERKRERDRDGERRARA